MVINRARYVGITAYLISTLAQAQTSPGDIPSTAFAKLESFVGAKISPNGERLAFLYPVENRWSVLVHTLASGDEIRIPPGREMGYVWLHWANDDTLVFSMSYSAVRQLATTEEVRLLSFDLTTNKMTRLVEPGLNIQGLPPTQVQDNVIHWLPDDPDHILVSLDEDRDNSYDVRKINVRTGDYENVRGLSRAIQHWISDASGDVRFGIDYRKSKFQARLKNSDGSWARLSNTNWHDDGWYPHGFSPGSSGMYVIGPGQFGTRAVRLLNLSDGSFAETVFSNETYDVEKLIEHPLTGQPAGVSYVSHRREFQYFDKELGKIQRALDKLFPDATNEITSMTRDQRKVVFESSSATNPGVVYIWDRDAKKIESFGFQMELIDPNLMSPVEAVEYGSGRTTIPAYLTLPAGAKPVDLPAIVLPHGGPASRDDQSFSFLVQFLASRGYAVLQPNFRGSEGYGYRFERAGRGQWGRAMQDDVAAGARWLVEQGIADKERVCIVGWSYGGYAAAMGLAKTPDLYKCGVSINGLYNLAQFVVAGKKHVGGDDWDEHIGLDELNARRVSPYHRAENIQAPLLIIHAEDDDRVQITQATSMNRRLKRMDKPVTFLKLPHGGHSMIDESARMAILENIEVFLAQNIGAR